MPSKATILVSGMIASDVSQGGATWAVLQYVLGLRQLNYEVYFVEPVQAKALRPVGAPLAATANAEYFHKVMSEFGLVQRSALLLAGTRETFGLPFAELKRAAERAEAIINISGMLAEEELIAKIPVRVYLDLDPAFNQLWHAVQGLDMRFANHTHFLTIGQSIGAADCLAPTCGLSWLKTFQPIVLKHWPVARSITCDALTTVGHWRGYGSIEHQGVHFGQKAHSLRQFFSLPSLTDEKFTLAMSIHPSEAKDLEALHRNGWQLLDPLKVADTPASYQRFIQGSKAEFGIAKSGYVASRCGWFSDRSVCYLASGRPVIAQETGFSRYLPTGEGLFAFKDSQDVLRAIEELRADYGKHAAQAREIAEEYFDSDKVLNRLMGNIS